MGFLFFDFLVVLASCNHNLLEFLGVSKITPGSGSGAVCSEHRMCVLIVNNAVAGGEDDHDDEGGGANWAIAGGRPWEGS